MQMNQVLDSVFVFGCLGSSGIGENGSYIGIGKTRMTVHDRLVKLVGMNLPRFIDKHVAHHTKTVNQWVE